MADEQLVHAGDRYRGPDGVEHAAMAATALACRQRLVQAPLSPIKKNLLPITPAEAHNLNGAISRPVHVQHLGASASLVPHVKVRSESQGVIQNRTVPRSTSVDAIPETECGLPCLLAISTAAALSSGICTLRFGRTSATCTPPHRALSVDVVELTPVIV